jgi:diguanylate cyclase (GGDEF)-like protein
MAYRIAGRITLNLVAEIIVTVVTVTLAIFWMATRQNEQAENATKTMVLGGIGAMEDHVKQFANDYSWWEAGYDAYVKGDRQWVDENYGSGVTDTQISDAIVIISTKGEIDYHWEIDGIPTKPTESFTPHVIENIQKLARDMPLANDAARSGYFRDGDNIVLMAVNRITPVSKAATTDAKTLPLLVQAVYLNQERLLALGKQFLIGDVRLQVGPPSAGTVAEDFPQIRDMDGNVIGTLRWTPPNPGYSVLQRVAPPVAAALLLFCVVALAAAYRTRRLAIKLTDSEKVAVIAARTDSLTSLKNRTGFNELIESAACEQACSEHHFAIVYMDVNGFKAVNDSIGHHGGDLLVKALADRMASVLPADAMLARIGGDEFAVALMGRGALDTASAAASAIVHSLDRPFTIEGFEFHVSASVGYAVASGAGLTTTEIVRRADIAMYHAKTGAEREAVAYHSTMETGALERKQVETALRRAIEQGDLQVFYQPVVRAGDLAIVGVEALVRWTSKEFGSVSPALFIPVAEDTGLIHEVGRFVVDRACQDLLKWPDLKMAINVSPVQLREPNFANDILAIVERYGLSPHQFELELTEGILVSNPTIAKRKLGILKDLGFTLALDDFGTGFSSIGYLRQFPFDILKVDRSFIRDIGLNTTANALIQSLVSLGDAMDLSVIAEGIENEEQLKLLRLVQCEYLQGFYISRPIPADEIGALLADLGTDKKIKVGAAASRRERMAAIVATG